MTMKVNLLPTHLKLVISILFFIYLFICRICIVLANDIET